MPADFAELDGAFPTIDVAGNGTGASPWNFTLNDEWAGAVADALSPAQPWPALVNRVQQSANITLANIDSRYKEINGLIHAYFYASCQSAGSAGTVISVQLPVPAAASQAGFGQMMVLDSGTAYYVGGAQIMSTTVVQGFAHNQGAGIGALPNFAIASGDSIWLKIMYRPA